MAIPTYEEILKRQRKENREILASIRAKENIVNIAREYAGKFCPLDSVFKYSQRYSWLDVNPLWTAELYLSLGKSDKIEDIYPLIDEMIKDPRLTMTVPLPKPSKNYEYSFFTCRFEEARSNGRDPETLKVSIHIGNICKRVVVGSHLQEDYKYVCNGFSDE